MNLPVLKILVIENELHNQSLIMDNLKRCADNFDRSDITIEVVSASNATKSMEIIEEDVDVQAVILCWSMESYSTDSIAPKTSLLPKYADFITAIKSIRVSLPIYILGEESIGLDIINESIDIESFFFRDDIIQDPESIMGYILNDFDDRCQTPFWNSYSRFTWNPSKYVVSR